MDGKWIRQPMRGFQFGRRCWLWLGYDDLTSIPYAEAIFFSIIINPYAYNHGYGLLVGHIPMHGGNRPYAKPLAHNERKRRAKSINFLLSEKKQAMRDRMCHDSWNEEMRRQRMQLPHTRARCILYTVLYTNNAIIINNNTIVINGHNNTSNIINVCVCSGRGARCSNFSASFCLISYLCVARAREDNSHSNWIYRFYAYQVLNLLVILAHF